MEMLLTEFQKLQLVDVIEPIRELIGNGITIRGDELHVDQKLVPSPWIINQVDEERRCELWTVWFNRYRFIPAGCRQCWKVTYSPKTLKEVYQVLELQDREKGPIGLPAKVGMENRSWTGNQGGYSAFWYTPVGCGLHSARGIYTRIQRELTKVVKYSPDLILKRGCTEFERLMGPSDTWDKTATERDWDEKEKILASVFRIDPPLQPSNLLTINAKLRMIYYAHEHGDVTYKDFVGKESLPPLTRYEKSIHSIKDFPSEDKNGINITGHKNADGSKEASPKLTLV